MRSPLFNPNDPELTQHIGAAKFCFRDVEKLLREREEHELFKAMLLTQRALEDALDRMNSMNRVKVK